MKKTNKSVKKTVGEKVEACPFCLSKDIDYTPGGVDSVLLAIGFLAPQAGRGRCKKCGKIVMPIVFKSESYYKKEKKKLGK